MSFRTLLDEVQREAERSASTWAGEHPADGTGGPDAERAADTMRAAVAQAFAEGRGTWRSLLMERVLEAFALEHPHLRDELVAIAGMAIAWARDLDQRATNPRSLVSMKSSG
jgi:hypothetical protein